uniref:Thioredoxin_16 domain-containing protein n=2 Tax=Schistosoma mansoni TaxID=6183 RepID=A0A3Q0KFR7_SCHMA
MYKLDRLIPSSINFAHTDTMYKLENFYHLDKENDSSSCLQISTEGVSNELTERDKSLLKELGQLDDNISSLLNMFKSYNPKNNSNLGDAQNASKSSNFISELRQLTYHISNISNHYKGNLVKDVQYDNIHKELSKLDLELDDILSMFTNYSHSQHINSTTTNSTPTTSNNSITVPKEPSTLIIQCNPNSPPLSVFLFCHILLSNQCKITINSFVHSTVKELSTSLKKLMEILSIDMHGSSINNTCHWQFDTKLCLHFIWNSSCPDITVSSLDKSITPTTLYGECMLVQLIGKILEPDNFDQLSSLIIIMDSSLLLPGLSIRNTTLDVKQKSLNILNNHPYFVKFNRELPSIVDCYLFVCIKELKLSDVLPANLKSWLQFCSKWKSFNLLPL